MRVVVGLPVLLLALLLLALLLLVLLLLAPLAVHAQASDAAFDPDTVVHVPDGPRVVLLRADPGGIAALRLSVPLVESAAEAGAGRMLAVLAERRMEGPARQIGARVSASRTPWGLAYSVEGAEVDLDYLTYLLRLATAEPRPESGAVEAIRAELIMDVERQAESAGDRVLAELRRAAAPELPPLAGSPGSLRLLNEARLRAVWQRSHRSTSMSLVAMTSVTPAALLAMLEAIGLPAGEVAAPLEAPDPLGASAGLLPLRSHLQDSLDWGGRTEGMQSDRASVTSRDCPDHRADRPVRLGLQVGFELDVWECQPSSPRPFGHL